MVLSLNEIVTLDIPGFCGEISRLRGENKSLDTHLGIIESLMSGLRPQAQMGNLDYLIYSGCVSGEGDLFEHILVPIRALPECGIKEMFVKLMGQVAEHAFDVVGPGVKRGHGSNLTEGD